MCFSAEASFAASGVLAAGSVAISRLPKERAGVPLSLIPTVFAAHQFVEGVLWLNHDGVLPDAYKAGAVYAYALIAYVLWPMWIPFSAYRLETAKGRRTIILVCQAIGVGTGLAVLLGFLRQAPAVSADCCSLSYQVNAPDLILAPYLVAVSVPFLASSRRSLVLFGVGVTASCAAAAALATATTFPSVWCFFAALLSAGLYWHFRAEAHTAGQPLVPSAPKAAAGWSHPGVAIHPRHTYTGLTSSPESHLPSLAGRPGHRQSQAGRR